MGFGRTSAHSLFMIFCGFEKIDQKSEEVFSNVVTLSEKLELDLQEDDFIELLAVQHDELTDGIGGPEKG